MIVLPGGGYAAHAPHEAEPVARWLGDIGVQASVFRYPLNVPGTPRVLRAQQPERRPGHSPGRAAGLYAAGPCAAGPCAAGLYAAGLWVRAASSRVAAAVRAAAAAAGSWSIRADCPLPS